MRRHESCKRDAWRIQIDRTATYTLKSDFWKLLLNHALYTLASKRILIVRFCCIAQCFKTMTNQNDNDQINATSQITQSKLQIVLVKNFEIVTISWLNKAKKNDKWMSHRDFFVQYFTATHERESSVVLTFFINENIQAIKQFTNDVKTFKSTITKRTIDTSFKNALMRAFMKKFFFSSSFKNHEIIVKMKQNMINVNRIIEKAKLTKQFNVATTKNNIKNIQIKIINKFFNENLIIQTKNAKKIMKLNENKAWITSLYEKKIKTMIKSYSIMIFTHKLQIFKKMTSNKIKFFIKIWNANLKSMHVASLQRNNKKNKKQLMLIFRMKKKINEIIQNDIVIEDKIHMIKIYNRKCRIKQCFKCYKYEHFSFRCINKQCCDRCFLFHVIFMKKNFHNECNKKNFDRCVACDKTHVT